MKLLWFALPDEALILVIAGVGLALVLGLIRGRAAAGILGALVLGLLATPFIEALMDALPWWVSLLILAAVGMALLRSVAAIFLGERAASEMTGILAADVVRFGFRLLFLPLRLLWRAFRRA